MNYRTLRCQFCKHILPSDPHTRVRCKAYPGGIPEEIMYEKVFHNKVIKGQEGDYIFTPDELYKKAFKEEKYGKES